MKLKSIFILTALISLVGLIHPTRALAAAHCDFPQYGSTTINVKCGGFSTPQELQSYTVVFVCIDKKSYLGNQIKCDPATDKMTQTFSLAGAAYAQDADGTYWTNITATGQNMNLYHYGINLIDGNGKVVQSTVVEAQPQPCSNNVCQTALGPISTDISGGFITDIIKIGLGLGSGFALLLILYGVFIVTTSSGIPDKLKQGRDIITSAIAGLIFIILSIFLLNFIGVKILAIPGL